MNELLEFEGGTSALALNLDEDSIGAVVLGDVSGLQEGQIVRATGRILSVPVGDGLLGRVVDSLGRPIDGLGPLGTSETRRLEVQAPGIIDRQPVKEPLQTGIKSIDAMTPIGRGPAGADHRGPQNWQDLDSHRHDNQPAWPRREVHLRLDRPKRLDGCPDGRNPACSRGDGVHHRRQLTRLGPCVLSSTWRPMPAAPWASIGWSTANDALIIYDDLSKQAEAYRSLSLLLRRPPGREAYPGDVFYLHSRLLERAAKLSDERGAGSLTALPIVETKAGDISAYIPTNVISITDGQIYLETDLFYAGIRPAVNVGLSVSRVGGDAQIKAMKTVSGGLKTDLAQFRELQAFATFGSELDRVSRAQLDRGVRLTELLKQPQSSPVPVEEQVVAIYAGTKGFLDDLAVDDVRAFESALVQNFRANQPDLLESIRTTKALPPTDQLTRLSPR